MLNNNITIGWIFKSRKITDVDFKFYNLYTFYTFEDFPSRRSNLSQSEVWQ